MVHKPRNQRVDRTHRRAGQTAGPSIRGAYLRHPASTDPSTALSLYGHRSVACPSHSPTLLDLSLFLFLVGLVILLFSLDYAIATVVLFIAFLAYSTYAATNLLPVWYSNCPYKTPLSIAFMLIQSWTPVFVRWHRRIQRSLHSKLRPGYPLADDATIPVNGHAFLGLEAHTVQRQGQKLDAQSLNWLCSMSANPSVSTTVAHAISGLPIPFLAIGLLRSGACMEHVCKELHTYSPWYHQNSQRLQDGSSEELTRYYVYVHAHLQLTSTLDNNEASFETARMHTGHALLRLRLPTRTFK